MGSITILRPLIFSIMLCLTGPLLSQTDEPGWEDRPNLEGMFREEIDRVLRDSDRSSPDPARQTARERQQTVERNLENLSSSSPDKRRAAVMLLGKYNLPAARQGVIQALEDSHSSVRLAALVSLFESPSMLPNHAQQRVVQMIGDEDVSIRRIVANVLPFVIHAYPVRFVPGNRHPSRHFPYEVETLLVAAFSDEDALVRRNLVSRFRSLNIALENEALVKLLHDEDEEVAMLSLEIGHRHLSPQEFASEMKLLVNRWDRLYRLHVTRYLRNNRSPEAIATLEILQQDEDRQVALEAGLALFQNRPGKDRYRTLIDELNTGRLYPETTAQIIESATLLGREGAPFLLEGIDHSSALYRRHCWQTVLVYFPDQITFDHLWTGLHDDSRDVRELAGRFLLRQANRWSGEDIARLAESSRSDNRQAAIDMIHRADPALRRSLLTELLLDEIPEVQNRAIIALSQHQVEGWETLLYRATRLPGTYLQVAALSGLLNQPTPEAIRRLKQFLEENPETPYRAQIQSVLSQQSP